MGRLRALGVREYRSLTAERKAPAATSPISTIAAIAAREASTVNAGLPEGRSCTP
jgi:hypothetical protein